MNDKTIIRPGGRRPRRGGSGGSDKPGDGDNPNATWVSSEPVPDPEAEPEREEQEDRTMIRPSRGSRRRTAKPETPTTPPREEKEPDLSAVDDIFGSLGGDEGVAPTAATPPRPGRRQSCDRTSRACCRGRGAHATSGYAHYRQHGRRRRRQDTVSCTKASPTRRARNPGRDGKHCGRRRQDAVPPGTRASYTRWQRQQSGAQDAGTTLAGA